MGAHANMISPKENLIKKEVKRLLKIFEKLDKNKLKTVEKLINTAAFLSVSLAELEKIINANGYVEAYRNGENQTGKKKTAAVDVHISMTKNYTAIIKHLAELAPIEQTIDEIKEWNSKAAEDE